MYHEVLQMRFSSSLIRDDVLLDSRMSDVDINRIDTIRSRMYHCPIVGSIVSPDYLL
jgi:hypothetical protein